MGKTKICAMMASATKVARVRLKRPTALVRRARIYNAMRMYLLLTKSQRVERKRRRNRLKRLNPGMGMGQARI